MTSDPVPTTSCTNHHRPDRLVSCSRGTVTETSPTKLTRDDTVDKAPVFANQGR